jgi:hypothetical protein
MTTPILSLPQVASNQNQKEATINSALAILEAACNDDISLSLASANKSLTTTEFTRSFFLKFTGHSVARVVTIPATPRFFAVYNAGTGNVTIQAVGSAGATVIVEPSKRVLIFTDGVDVVAISAGVSLLSSLTDVVGAADASGGQLLAFDGTASKWGPIDYGSDHSVFVAGSPTASQKVYRRRFVRAARLFSDFAGSSGGADVAATGSTVFNVYKNATLVGTVTYAAAGTVPTFSTNVGSGSVSVTFAAGDTVTVIAPASPDATLAGLDFTLKGVFL